MGGGDLVEVWVYSLVLYFSMSHDLLNCCKFNLGMSFFAKGNTSS